MTVRNEQKTFIAFVDILGNSVCINPAQVTRVEEDGSVRVTIFTTDRGHVTLNGDIDKVVESLEEGLV